MTKKRKTVFKWLCFLFEDRKSNKNKGFFLHLYKIENHVSQNLLKEKIKLENKSKTNNVENKRGEQFARK